MWWPTWLLPGAVAFDVPAVDVCVALAGEFVDEVGVTTVLTQPVAPPHLVKCVREEA